MQKCRWYSKFQVYSYSTVLGAAIKCKQCSEITVESGTHVKSVKITLNIFFAGSCVHANLRGYNYLP